MIGVSLSEAHTSVTAAYHSVCLLGPSTYHKISNDRIQIFLTAIVHGDGASAKP